MQKTNWLAIPAVALLFSSVAPAANTTVVSLADISAMTYKVNMAARFFESTWSEVFASAGYKYPAPRLVSYRGSLQSKCGLMESGNAHYCAADHSIYYDEVFLAAMMKNVGAARGSDGDYAPIVILAHEMGHAVAAIFKIDPAFTITREHIADCLAGVVTKHAAKSGNLESGDMEEGLLALTLGGDREGEWILSDGAHGSGAARRSAFMDGYNQGVGGCDATLARSLASRR